MIKGRPAAARTTPARSSASTGEVLFELVTRGAATRCAAIDADTGVEVVVIGPHDASEAYLKAVALRKLRLRLGRGQGS